MTCEENVHLFKGRIAEAEARRNTWRAAGCEEKYLEPYFMVEALGLQLHKRLRRRAAGQSLR